MDTKAKKKVDVLNQRLQKLRQQLAGARKQQDEPDEVSRLETEMAQVDAEIKRLKEHSCPNSCGISHKWGVGRVIDSRGGRAFSIDRVILREVGVNSMNAFGAPGESPSLPPELQNTLDLSQPALIVRSYGLTHGGKVRPNNQDQFLIAALRKALRIVQSSVSPQATHYADLEGHLFLVADGMGGHAAGEQASALAVGAIEDFALNTLKWFFHLGGSDGNNVLAEFASALAQADHKLIQEAVQHPELRGMGTTVTLAYSVTNTLFVVHVGDSRCYLFRDGQLYRLTRDHTLVEELVERGQLSPEQASRHQLRHVVTNVVGGAHAGIQAEAHKLALEAGDALLLCTDGLTQMLNDDQIAAVLQLVSDPRSACECLVAHANELGGKDNVTAIVARYEVSQATR